MLFAHQNSLYEHKYITYKVNANIRIDTNLRQWMQMTQIVLQDCRKIDICLNCVFRASWKFQLEWKIRMMCCLARQSAKSLLACRVSHIRLYPGVLFYCFLCFYLCQWHETHPTSKLDLQIFASRLLCTTRLLFFSFFIKKQATLSDGFRQLKLHGSYGPLLW